MTDTSKALKPTLTFLQQYVPFKQMLPAHQEYLAMHLEQVFYSEHDEIVLPQDGVAESLYIVKNGRVSANIDNKIKIVEVGQCFPIKAITNNRAVNYLHRADKSTICYRLTHSHFEYLMQQSVIFHDFVIKQQTQNNQL
ncbi:MAG: hypothetical protein OQL19_03690 [Gammaproteobacteria bacterium]|nr:hypothetical protein [Gammaproteobacteria bacterium]